MASTPICDDSCENVAASTSVCHDSCENVVASTPDCDDSCENVVASTPVCDDSCKDVMTSTSVWHDSRENVTVVSASPSSATRHVVTMPHTETSSSQDNIATTTVNHTPSPVEASSLQNRSCREVVDKKKYRSLLRTNQRHRRTIKDLKKKLRELQNVSVKQKICYVPGDSQCKRLLSIA